jgi:hypothetical protein
METARVDIRKLQLLNDRINQTIDALNQVRFSVHGVQTNVPNAVTGLGIGHTTPTVNPYFNNFANFANPYLAQQAAWNMGVNPFANFATGLGLGHTGVETFDPTFNNYGRIAQTFPFAPWGYSPFAQGFTPFASGIY